MFQRRLRCHFCGTRSKYFRGTISFDCPSCEALNFFDANGEVTEPPSGITNPPQIQQQFIRATSPVPTTSRPLSPTQPGEIFCQRCLNNQRMYVDALNNYLPDEDNPRYQEYIDLLPRKKAELEKKYPQVCTKCAPKAQERIYQADYYGMSQQAAAAMSKTKASRSHSAIGRRDDLSKRLMRLALTLVRLLVYGSMLVQACWHAYGMCLEVFSRMASDREEAMPFVFEPDHKDCFKQSLLLRFDTSCHRLLGRYVLSTLLVTPFLLWYNPCLKAWYHHTNRIETINGQADYLYLQVFLLTMRAIAWYNLRNVETTARLSTPQLLASHGSAIAFMALVQWVSERNITTEKWKIKGKIMPRPSEEDVFGQTAGPADEQYTRQASSTHPMKLFTRDQKPFPIANLAASPGPSRGYSRLDHPGMPPPSPPGTESASDDDNFEAMDIDTPPARTAGMPGAPIDRTFRPKSQQPRAAQHHRMYIDQNVQPSGWGAMLGEVFGMQDQMRLADERIQQEKEKEEQSRLRFQSPAAAPSPFRGHLPQAPMSVGRRLRNPPSQPLFKVTPLSQRQDFMKQMQPGFGSSTTFSQTESKRDDFRTHRDADGDDGMFSPAKTRTRGNLDLKPSSWHLPTDAQQTTGLEELLGGKSFAIADEPPVNAVPPSYAEKAVVGFSWTLPVVMMVLAVLVAALNIRAIRRPLSLWLLSKMEDMGL